MGSREKLLDQITGGRSDANVTFDDLCNLLIYLGFEMRTRGSHRIFRKTGIAERINLQRDGTNAKPYQVQQVRNIVLKYRLGAED